MRLANNVAIITGSGSGIGRAIAERYAREGAMVVIADINRDAAEHVATEIQAQAGQAHVVQVDVSQAGSVQAMVTATLAQYGRIDILVNNAGIEYRGDTRTHELTEEVWDLIMGVNLRGYWLCSKYVIPVMLQQGGGAIIHLASPTGFTAAPHQLAYSTSKGGVAAMVRTMAIEYARENIRVNAIVPGFIDSPLNAGVLPNDATRSHYGNMLAAGRLGKPEDLAGIAVFLASEEAAFCFGGFYWVDGGALAQSAFQRWK
jgi:meso-butanediol dehydrogenase / (S,S)-butanediol dehydrogenase / diacetyl reductase